MELNKLCSHLPRKWKTECSDLVKTYSRELVELLLADLTPEEVCSYIKLCDDAQDASLKNMFNSNEDGQICMYPTSKRFVNAGKYKFRFIRY